MEGCLVGATKMIKGYMWNVTGNSNLNLIENTCPHPGMVLRIRIGGVQHVC